MKKLTMLMLLVSMSFAMIGNGLFTPKGSMVLGGAYMFDSSDSAFALGGGYVFNDVIDFSFGIQLDDEVTPITVGGKYYITKPNGKDSPLAAWANADYTFYSMDISGTNVDISQITLGGNVGYEVELESITVVPYMGLSWVQATISIAGISVSDSATGVILGADVDFTPKAKNKILGGFSFTSIEGFSVTQILLGYTF